MSRGLAALSTLLRARSGLAIGPDKLYLLETRLAAIMKREAACDLTALADRLPGRDALAREVVEAMTTNESLFFRDTKPFEALRLRILPRLHAARPPGTPLRIWSAAASSGQEAYSIAMTAADSAGSLVGRRIEIVATDIAREPLRRAREGVYSKFEIQRGLTPQMLAKHFIEEPPNWRIKPALREAVIFREQNLLGELSGLGTFDVIFCRNVLIYFDAATKREVLEGVCRRLAPDGVLFLGGAETTLGLSEKLKPLAAEGGAYSPEAGLF